MNIRKILAAVLAGVISLPALAAAPPSVTVFDFANLQYGGSPHAFSGFVPNELLNSGEWKCTSYGDLCSSDIANGVLGGDLKYMANGINVAATGYYYQNGAWTNATAMQDHEEAYNAATKVGAGLGVYHVANSNSDDKVTANEKLVLTFASEVKITGLSLRSEGLDTNNFKSGATFLLNGVSTSLSNDIGGLNLVGTQFVFSYGGTKADQFYLGSLSVMAVPEASTYAMWLAGLGLLGFVARRRRRNPIHGITNQIAVSLRQ